MVVFGQTYTKSIIYLENPGKKELSHIPNIEKRQETVVF